MSACKFCCGELGDNGFHVREPWRLEQHNCELYELRALRDRLVKPLVRDGLENYGRIADISGEDDMEFEGELSRIIARAQELAQ